MFSHSGSHHKYTRIPFSPHPCPRLLFFVLFIIFILISVLYHFGFDSISMIISYVEHLSCMCWQSVPLPWKNVCSDRLHILKSDFCFILFLLLLPLLLVSHLKNHCQNLCQGTFSLFASRNLWF